MNRNRPISRLNAMTLIALCGSALDDQAPPTARAMKFGDPLLSSELSGALAGVVGSKARGGVNYFRVRARPGNPKSYLQNSVRSIVSGLAAAWKSVLSDTERAAWAALASGSESGIDVYVGNNSHLLRVGIAKQNTAPASRVTQLTPAAPDNVTVAADATGAYTIAGTVAGGDLWIGAASGAGVGASAIEVWATRHQSPSRLSQQNPFSGYAFFERANTGAAITGANVGTAMENALTMANGGASIPQDSIVYVKFRAVLATGEISGEQTYRVVVQAA